MASVTDASTRSVSSIADWPLAVGRLLGQPSGTPAVRRPRGTTAR